MSRNSMSAPEFFALVKQDFRCLMDEYGFAVTTEEITNSFDVCAIALEAAEWCIRVVRERGSVDVQLGPLKVDDRWFPLGDIVTFLERGSPEGEEIWFGPSPDKSLDYVSQIQTRLEWLAKAMRPYCDRLRDMFRADNFEQIKGDLAEWGRLKERKRWEAIYRDKPPG